MPSTATSYQRFHLTADSGRLKVASGEWQYMQNLRGWGGRGRKRQGISTSARLDSGIMGMFDIENGAGSTDAIMVITNAGNMLLYDFSELTTAFDYLVTTGRLLLQSPNLDWWNVYPGAATGIMQVDGVAAPASSISTDLRIGQGETFGFLETALVWRLNITSAPAITTKQYALAGGSTTYSTDLAFSTGYGPVFEDEYLVGRRLTVADGGFLSTIEV